MLVHWDILTYTYYSGYDLVYDKFYTTTPNTVDKKMVAINYIPSSEMVAHGMTKSLGRSKLDENCKMYGMLSRSLEKNSKSSDGSS